MQITATELKANLGKYLDLAETEDIHITKNGRATVKLSSSNKDRLEIAHSLFGIIPSDISLDKARKDYWSQKLGYDV